jgi:hypothetical protein
MLFSLILNKNKINIIFYILLLWLMKTMEINLELLIIDKLKEYSIINLNKIALSILKVILWYLKYVINFKKFKLCKISKELNWIE